MQIHSSTMHQDVLLASNDFYQNPHPILHRLRAEAPVFWSDAWGVWVLTRYDDVVAALKDHDIFVNYGRVTYLLEQLPDNVSEAKEGLLFHYKTGLAHTDPPIHTRLRGLLNRAFTPRMVSHWTGRIEQVVSALLENLKQKQTNNQRRFDLLHDFAYPLPATIIGEMLGVPPADVDQFQGWALAINQLFEKGGRVSERAAVNAHNNLKEMRSYIDELVRRRRKQPSDDVIGNLVQLEATGEKLSLNELTSTVVTFFVAGHDTTTNLIANAVYLLMQNRDALTQLREDPALVQTAVEETLRLEPSVPRMWRIAARDTAIGEQQIQAGQMVFPMLSAANRDPDRFPNPDRFLLDRANIKHVAFGFGIHYCIGAPLARLEAQIALRRLIAAFPQMQLAETPIWTKDIAIRRLETLMLTA